MIIELQVFKNGAEYWLKDEYAHRDDGPSAICPDGSRFWYNNGRRYKSEGPAKYFVVDYQWDTQGEWELK